MFLILLGAYFYLSSTFLPNKLYKRMAILLDPYFGETTDIFFMVFGLMTSMTGYFVYGI